ncbi:hypothetical protein B296_00028964 [Ensete ventricosum]|uniref:Uncharacterized protein n=1 Tax=Ensete ventricosum TaxID=4639 RepID=A0A426YWC3_ENSVE|nr:hypothetical protein B296_00028964 [Ensete ventricosum]
MMKDILTQVSQVPREMGGIGQHDEVMRIRCSARNRLLAIRLEHPAIKLFPCVSVRMKPIPSEEKLALNESSRFRKWRVSARSLSVLEWLVSPLDSTVLLG